MVENNNVPQENFNKTTNFSKANAAINTTLATGLAIFVNEYLKDKDITTLGKVTIVTGLVAITVGLAFGVKSKNKE